MKDQMEHADTKGVIPYGSFVRGYSSLCVAQAWQDKQAWHSDHRHALTLVVSLVGMTADQTNLNYLILLQDIQSDLTAAEVHQWQNI